jgi:hypothetical protein
MTNSMVKIIKKNRDWALTRFEYLIKKSKLEDADSLESEFKEWVDLSSDLDSIEVLAISFSDNK